MAAKCSFADQFYDRACQEYTLKYEDTGEYAVMNRGGNRWKITAYRVDGVGTVCIVRAAGTFGKKTEACIFAPLFKDAPLLVLDSVRPMFGEAALHINLFDTCLEKRTFRQFSQLEESWRKLADADYEDGWYNGRLIPGSAAKKAKDGDLTGMLEEYLNAYFKCVEFAEICGVPTKKEKLAEIREGFLTKGGAAADTLKKAIGEEAAAKLFENFVFPA